MISTRFPFFIIGTGLALVLTLTITALGDDSFPLGLNDDHARIRHEAVLAIWQAGETRWTEDLIDLAVDEDDRLVFYSIWGALRHLQPRQALKDRLDDSRDKVRLAALLALLEDDALSDAEIAALSKDTNETIAGLATRRAGGKTETIIKGPALHQGAGKDTENDPARPPLNVVDAIESKQPGYREATLLPGARAYLDRHYRFREIPNELHGETFILVANNEAETESGGGFTLQLRSPSTIYLADDVRGEALPKWARGRYEPTKMSFHNGDSTMRVYQAEFPTGKVSFGGNREDLRAHKSHYHIIIKPHLIQPQETAPTTAEVLEAMATAKATRGRTLFLSAHGATCATCHQLEGIGNVFAPDLSEIGDRADAEFLIQSILEPSAQITEGFAMQMVTKKSGESIGGIVLEETGRALTFGVVGGQTVTVVKSDVAKRETVDISAMPPLGPTLSAQQVADLTTFLLSLKRKEGNGVPEARTKKRQSPSLSGKSWGHEKNGFRLLGYDERLDIQLNGQPIASYYFDHPETRRPFFAHVKTPDGRQVTRNFPPVEGQDPTDHAYMHPGLSLGFAVLNGENFWHNDRGIVELVGLAGEPQAGATSAAFTVTNRYLAQDGSEVCQETARYAIQANADGYLIALDTEFSSDQPFYFGVREEMGLAARVASPLRVRDGNGSIYSAKGGRDEKGTWGLVDQWWDYAGTLNGRHVGLQLISGPGNPPVWAHSRDYGLLVANPFPVDRKPNRDKKTMVEPGQSLRLRFGTQVHEHGVRTAFDPAKAAARYLESIEAFVPES